MILKNVNSTLKILILLLLSTGLCYSADKLQPVAYNNPDLVVNLGVGLWAWPLPMDYDGDGDYDLLVSCPDKPYNGTYFFENTTGDGKSPLFAPAVRLSGSINNAQISHTDDGPIIMSPAMQWENVVKGQKHKAKKIYPQDNLLRDGKTTRANQWKQVDFDGDGDLDLVVGVGYWLQYGWDNAYDSNGDWLRGPLHGYVYLIENTGTTDTPEYKDPIRLESAGIRIDTYGMPSPNFADFDGDGDLDLLCGSFVDDFTYFENVGSRTKPDYSPGKIMTYKNKRLTMDLCMIVPTAIDWDKDGDVDLIVGEEDGTVSFMEHTGEIEEGVPVFKPPVYLKQQAENVKFGALVTPHSIDWDGDGDEDIIAGNTAGYIGFIENLDGGNPPKWAAPQYLRAYGEPVRIMAGYNGSIQGPCETKWGYTTLTVADWDHDGHLDIVANSIWGKVVWFRNNGQGGLNALEGEQSVRVAWKGATPKPAWTWWTPEAGTLAPQWRTTPYVTDLDKDGLNDLVMLDHEGYLSFFKRTKQDGALILQPGEHIFKNGKGEALRLNERTAGGSGRKKICLVDWDRDGKLDLLMNSRNINFYKNTATKDGEYVFEDQGEVDSRLLAGHTTSPTVVDWDKNGVPDLLVGAEDGFFYYMKNPN